MAKPMMKCGHSANAIHDGKPCCVMCIGIMPGAEEVDVSPIPEGRMASCAYCQSVRPSSPDLPFFGRGFWTRGVRDETRDSFYCGCRGWD